MIRSSNKNQLELDFYVPFKSESKKKDNNEENQTPHKGMLIIDATVALSDIAFPTDTNLLNHARETYINKNKVSTFTF